MIENVAALVIGAWLLYLSVQGVRTGTLYSRTHAGDDGHEYTHRNEKPVQFWCLLAFYVGVAAMFILAGFFM